MKKKKKKYVLRGERKKVSEYMMLSSMRIAGARWCFKYV